MLGKILGVLGALILIATYLLPWIVTQGLPTPDGEGVRPDTITIGKEFYQGLVVAILGTMSVLTVVARIRLAIIPAALALATLVWFYFAELTEAPDRVHADFGLYLVILGAILVIAGALLYRPRM